MKIGVLTYHCPPNFGAQLQAVSTVGYLRRLGHEVIVLHWYARDLEEMYSHRIPSIQVDCHNRFANEALPLSHLCQTEEELILEVEKQRLDAIVVGSDALFKYVPARNRRYFSKRKLAYVYHQGTLSCELLDGNPFFGAFLQKLKQNIPASTYAVSSQNCPYHRLTRQEKKRMASAMSSFRHISVRDAWTQEMARYITSRKDISIAPDPVLCFELNNYLTLPTKEEILQKYNLQPDYILFSFRNKFCPANYILQLAKETSKHNIQPVALPMPEHLFDAGISTTIHLPLSPIDWYALIKYSKGYVGERMHPIVVALHNNIPFFSFDEYGTKTRQHWYSQGLSYNPFSSKTYQIVSEAGFLSNLHSYLGAEPMPSPENVINKVLTFDTDKCRLFSLRKQQEYEMGMQKVLSSFVK